MCLLWGQKEDKKLVFRMEQFSDSNRGQKQQRKHLFFLYFEKLHRGERVFSSFFSSSFSMHCSLLYLSFLSLFSLFSLVCFCLKFSPHNFLAAAQSSNHHLHLSSLKVNNNTRAFYLVNVQNKNRTQSRKRELFDTRRLLY